jgi:hypothetical protein
MRGVSVTPLARLHEVEIVALLPEGKHDEIESHRYSGQWSITFTGCSQALCGVRRPRLGDCDNA